MNKALYDKLFNDFLDLGEKYKDEMSIPVFGGCMITFLSKMLRDTAPSEVDFRVVVDEAINQGIIWHYEEKK